MLAISVGSVVKFPFTSLSLQMIFVLELLLLIIDCRPDQRSLMIQLKLFTRHSEIVLPCYLFFLRLFNTLSLMCIIFLILLFIHGLSLNKISFFVSFSKGACLLTRSFRLVKNLLNLSFTSKVTSFRYSKLVALSQKQNCPP